MKPVERAEPQVVYAAMPTCELHIPLRYVFIPRPHSSTIPMLQGGNFVWGQFWQGKFREGKFRHTSHFGAGPSDTGNFNTPNPWLLVDNQSCETLASETDSLSWAPLLTDC